jgi:chaperone BCS1
MFTTAELQGFLLTCKFRPERAVREAKEWVENTTKEKKELEEKKKAKQEKAREKRDMEEVGKLQSTLMKMSEIGPKAEQREGRDSSTRKVKESEDAKSEAHDRHTSDENSSSTSRSHSPGSALESDIDSWTVTEPAPDQDNQRK